MSRDPRFAYLSHHPLNGATTFGTMEERGELLEIACWRCDHVARRAGDELVVRYGRAAAIGEIYDKLRCKCGASHPRVDVVKPLS